MSAFDHALLRIEWGIRGLACLLLAEVMLESAIYTAGGTL